MAGVAFGKSHQFIEVWVSTAFVGAAPSTWTIVTPYLAATPGYGSQLSQDSYPNGGVFAVGGPVAVFFGGAARPGDVVRWYGLAYYLPY